MRRTAAEIAAAAVYESYPDVELWGGGETPTGFSYDFYFPHPIHAHIIEEKIRQIIHERRPIRTMEMVSFSAGELLKSEGHHARVSELEEGMVEIIQIGSFHDLSPGPHLKNTAELAAFKISAKPLPDKGMRLTGWCHNSKSELKEFLKKLNNYCEPEQLGEKMGLWKGGVWLSEGLKMRQHLIQFLKKQWFQDAFEIAAPAGGDRTTLHRSFEKEKVAEFWSEGFQETHLQISFFDQSEEDMISCLQSIGKTLTILGFDHSTSLKGRVTDYVVEDGIGRSHTILQVKRTSRKGSPTVDFCINGVVEKMLFLLLEKNLMMVELEN
ncbi:MAG: hypothetical protein COT85_03550 [Chlamydiae bacterium CG10_big_fil_rev_8_21_14_0_10_42_34]|nr:MAG: hypothetical protein COT85_03550 [Chlamydiae bacterium CG10_big_fil_rev_8_21_14_0_10_42_34]